MGRSSREIAEQLGLRSDKDVGNLLAYYSRYLRRLGRDQGGEETQVTRQPDPPDIPDVRIERSSFDTPLEKERRALTPGHVGDEIPRLMQLSALDDAALPRTAPARQGVFRGLPVYIVLDTSSSMSPHEQLLNETLASICDLLFTSPKVSEFIHLSIVSFNTAPHLVVGMTEMARMTAPPRVSCNGSTNYAPMFQLLRDRIEIDVASLSAAGVRVLRPAVFLLTDGAPTDRDGEWDRARAELTDREWRLHPNIITYGFGDSSEAVLRRVSTLAAYLAGKDKAASNREALEAALTSLLNAMVASAQAERLLIPEEVEGFKSVPLDYVYE